MYIDTECRGLLMGTYCTYKNICSLMQDGTGGMNIAEKTARNANETVAKYDWEQIDRLEL
jgi:hypothetical protein